MIFQAFSRFHSFKKRGKSWGDRGIVAHLHNLTCWIILHRVRRSAIFAMKFARKIVFFLCKLNFWSNRAEIKQFWRKILSSSWFSCFLDSIPHSLKQVNYKFLQENTRNLPLNIERTSKKKPKKYSSIHAIWSPIFTSIGLVSFIILAIFVV